MGKKKYQVSSSAMAKYERMDAPFLLFVTNNMELIEGIEMTYPADAIKVLDGVSDNLLVVLDSLLGGNVNPAGGNAVKARRAFCKRYPHVALAKVFIDAEPLAKSNLQAAEEARAKALQSLSDLTNFSKNVKES